jgi:hypothetical protein
LYHMVFMVLFCVFFIHNFCFLYIQIYQWLEKLHFIDSWRKGGIGKLDLLKYLIIFIFVNRIHLLKKEKKLKSQDS